MELELMFQLKPSWYGVNFDRDFWLIDPESGDRYRVHSIKGGAPLNRNLLFKRGNGNIVLVTLIFPPVAEGLSNMNIVEGKSPDNILPPNIANTTYMQNIPIQDGDSPRDYRIIPFGDRDFAMYENYNVIEE